jgi:integrase
MMAKVNFTAGRIAGHQCPGEKSQSFLWDTIAPGLGLRVTPTGKPAYIFQSAFQGRSLRMTIGSPDAWSIPAARIKARELQSRIDSGRDPRIVESEITATDVAKREGERRNNATVGEVWKAYLSDRSHKWGARHLADHIAKAAPGGEPSKRGTRGLGVTVPGPLHPLMALKLRNLDAATIEAWATKEGKKRPSSARLAWRLLKAFLSWCAEQKEYAQILPQRNPAITTRSREALGKPQTKKDVLGREQLPGWFAAVRQIGNPIISAYLQCLLLMGCRAGELRNLRWQDINSVWRGIQIRDKVEGTREIPLTPYVWSLLSILPHRSEFVFAGANRKQGNVAPISSPNHQLGQVCAVAGMDSLTLHGLRRSFKSLTEWLDVPAGVVAQIQGHKPSATVEKHYAIRSLDLLRLHHEKIEAWILEQAGIKFVPGQLGLRVVTAG